MYMLYKYENGRRVTIGPCKDAEAGAAAIEMDKKLHGGAEKYELIREEQHAGAD